MHGTDSGIERDRLAGIGPESVDARLVQLLVLTTLLGAGHHVDHVLRGNHVGWPVTPEVTLFTYSLAVYPLLVVGAYLTLTERGGAGTWAVLLGSFSLLVVGTHFGPWAVEPPAHVVEPHGGAGGYVALAWLVAFAAAILATTGYAVYRWRRCRD